ncbi:MAG TPA: MXAN_5187 C-terminal domain-containing protein, partial [Polyangiales bacterium]
GKKVNGQDAPKGLKERLRTLNQQLEELRADLLIAVDEKGLIVAQEGRRPAREGAGLGKVPLVERALAGYLGDDVWVYDGEVYRVAARPVVDRGVYVGALVHAQKLDTVLAQRLSERLGGATVAFFFRDSPLASYTPTDVPGAPTQAELIAPLKLALADPKLKRGERTDPYEIDGRGRVTFSLAAGSASSADVGYALARPYKTIATPFAVFENAKKDDVAALPKGALAGGFLLLFAAAMGIMYLERDRPISIFRKQVERLARGETEELNLPALSSAYRKIGEQLHKALDVIVEKGGGSRNKQRANLDEILGPTPENLTSSAFSFGSNDAAPAAPGPVAMPAPGAAPMPAPQAMPAPMPAPPAMPAPQAKAPPMPPPKMPAPPPAAPPPPKLAAPGADANGEDSHFRDVYAQYVDTRKQCGESVAELTFDKFVVTLRKNRDQILNSRADAQGVRFSVYVKDGKAALKAVPTKA